MTTIIGIAGGSGAGKTTLAKALVDSSNGRALLISHDRYYRFMPCGNYDLPGDRSDDRSSEEAAVWSFVGTASKLEWISSSQKAEADLL